MRILIGFLMITLFTGCVTGPQQETYELQAMGEEEGRKLVAIATRNTLGNYDGKMADVWFEWKRGEARIKGKKPPAGMSAEQAQIWAAEVGDQLVRAAAARDNKLMTLDKKRAIEIEQIQQLHANQLKAISGIISGWAVQGKISKGQLQVWMGVAQQGAAYYMEQQHIRKVRKEAEEAAAREAAAEHYEEEE